MTALADRSARRRLEGMIAGVCALAAALGLWLAMPWGITVSSGDSVDYFEGARHLALGEGYIASVPPAPARPVTQFPPLYSLVLALGPLTGADVFTSAKALNAACFGATLFLLLRLLSLATRGDRSAVICGGLLLTLNPVLLSLYSTAFSEAVFLPLSLAGQCVLLRYAQRRRLALLAAAAVFLGLAAAARYAGVVWLATGTLFVLAAAPAGWPRRLGHAALFGAVAILPPLGVAIRNRLVGGTVANRHSDWHLFSLAHLQGGLQTIAGWFLPWRLMSWRTGLLLVLAGGTLATVLLWHRRRDLSLSLRCFLGLQALFLPLYALQALAAISLVAFDLALDERIMAPVQITVIALAAALLTLVPPGRLRQGAMAILALTILLGAGRTATWVKVNLREGSGYRSRPWAAAAFTKALALLPPERLLYSNKPEAVYFLTGHAARPIPFKAEVEGRTFNPRSGQEMATMWNQLRTQGGLIAYFQPPRFDLDFSGNGSGVPLNRLYKFSEAELQAQGHLLEVARSAEAVLYRVAD